MSNHRPVEEQVIVVTGASSGIGLSTALMAGSVGAKLVLNARSIAQTAIDRFGRMAAKQMERQQYDEPPRDPAGALHQPKRSGRTYGTGGKRATT